MNHFLAYSLYCIVVIILLLLYFLYFRKQIIIRRWQRSLNLKEHGLIFQQLFADVNGFLLSKNARQNHDAMEYVYGEIEFESFIALLSLTKPDKNTVFYDLGSGVGKAVLACCMVFPIHQSVGIELFPELYFEACRQVEKLAVLEHYKENAKKVHFILGNFLESNLNDATLIFINSSAFFGPSWEQICNKLQQLPHLKTVITTSKPLTSACFSLVTRTKVEMSWGVVFAYIHKRTICV